jgi:putative ABC transport system substrate-binding protein
VAAIVGNVPAAKVAKETTTTLPIVFVYGGDPVKDGLVASFNRPSGNVTGVTFLGGLVGGRRVQLLHDLAPQAGVIALLLDANNITSLTELNDLEAAVQALRLNSVVGMSPMAIWHVRFISKCGNSLLLGHFSVVPALDLVPSA